MTKSIESVLADNLEKLIKASPDLDSNPKISRVTKIGTGTLSRLRNADSSATISSVAAIARAFDLQAADLLREDLFDRDGKLQPTQPRAIQKEPESDSPRPARDLIARLRSTPLSEDGYKALDCVFTLAESTIRKK